MHVPGSVRFHLVAAPDACIAEVQLDGRLRSAAFCGNGLFVCVVEQKREPVCWHVGKSGPGWSATAVPVPMKLEGSKSASCMCWLKQRGLTHQADTWLLLTGCSEGSFCLGKYSPEARQIQAIRERPHKPFTEASPSPKQDASCEPCCPWETNACLPCTPPFFCSISSSGAAGTASRANRILGLRRTQVCNSRK